MSDRILLLNIQSQDNHVSCFLNDEIPALFSSEGLTAPCKKGLAKPNVPKFKHQILTNSQVISDNQESFQLVVEHRTA